MHLSLSGPTKNASVYMCVTQETFKGDSLKYFPGLYFLTITQDWRILQGHLFVLQAMQAMQAMLQDVQWRF